MLQITFFLSIQDILSNPIFKKQKYWSNYIYLYNIILQIIQRFLFQFGSEVVVLCQVLIKVFKGSEFGIY